MGRLANHINSGLAAPAYERPRGQPSESRGRPPADDLTQRSDLRLGGRYQILRQLGAGGFSRTFLVADMHLPNQPKCVLKQLQVKGQDPTTLDMARRLFETEAQVLYHLGNHPQIPTLLAHFEEDQEFYLAQEYIEGSRLSHQMAGGKPWSETRVVLLLQEVLEILAFIHRQQVIHRDVKPSNLIRRHRDGKVVLIDFGAVKPVGSLPPADTEASTTRLTVAIGTQGYMPNEQSAGKPRFSSDVYAVGILGIRALTGRRPHTLAEDPDTCEIHWRPYAPGVSSGLADVLDRMVRYDFRDRYPTAQDALEALQHLPNGFRTSITHLYQTWHRGVEGLVPSPISAPGQAQLVPTETSETTAIASAQEETALLPVHLSMPTAPITTPSPGDPPVAPPPLESPVAAAPPAPEPDPSTPPEGSATVELPLPRSNATPLPPPWPRWVWPWGLGGIAGVVGLLWYSGVTLTLTINPPRQRQAVTLHPLTLASLTASPFHLLPPPDQAPYLTQQANRLMAQGRYPEALDTYDAAIATHVDYAPAYLGRCRALVALHLPSEAMAACDDALAYQPGWAEALRSKGHAEELQGRLQEALILYETLNRQTPALAAAWVDRGRVLQRLGRSAEALLAVDEAIRLDRNSAAAWTVRGEADWTLERHQEAAVALDKALQVDPNYAPAQRLRQHARQALGY